MSKNPKHLVGCDGISRRDFVRIGSLSAFGIGVPFGDVAIAGPQVSTRRCILIWLDGGPSHLETFDLKPNAPAEVRGPFAPIATSVPGISVCEWMPETAKRMEHIALIRSMTSPLGEHNFGTHYLMTGYKPTPVLEYPTMGSVVAHVRGNDRVLPQHIAIPQFRVGGGRFAGNGFLPSESRPFSIGSDPAKPNFSVRDLDYFPGLDGERVGRRRRFVDRLDQIERQGPTALSAQDAAAADQAYRLIASKEAKAAFELEAETADTRRRYGNKSIGQSCLLARRLVERGVSFVTVNNPGWDTHEQAYTRLKEGYTGARIPVGLVPSLDMALGALIDDLKRTDLLDETLIVVMGEFGRTPKLNTRGGRDHWPRVFSVLLAGGGIRGGQVVGESDRVGEGPKENPITPADLACTIYNRLGVDPRQNLHTADGRPVQISRDGTPIPQLIS